MTWIYPEQLSSEFKKNKFVYVYILFGNDLCLLQDSHLNILNAVRKIYNVDYFNIGSNINFDWDAAFKLCKTINLFQKKKLLSLRFPENYSITYFNEKIPLLSSLIHNDLILILFIYTSNYIQQHNTWMKCFNKIGLFINCVIPNPIRLGIWIKNQSQQMKLSIENLACQLLCYYYEGNTILLKQTLQYLSLIYPDKILTFDRIKNVITDSAYFTHKNWIESILTGNKQRSHRILKQLKNANFDFKILLYKIQYEILILIQIKYNLRKGYTLFSLFKKYKINSQYHRMIISKAIHRLNFYQLYKAISLLTEMELKYHQNCEMNISESNFMLLTEILCHNNNKIIQNRINNINI